MRGTLLRFNEHPIDLWPLPTRSLYYSGNLLVFVVEGSKNHFFCALTTHIVTLSDGANFLVLTLLHSLFILREIRVPPLKSVVCVIGTFHPTSPTSFLLCGSKGSYLPSLYYIVEALLPT